MRSWTGFLRASLLTLAPVLGAQEPAVDATAPPAIEQTPSAAAPQTAKTPETPQAGPRDATELFAAFARIEGLDARFVEQKQLALLAAPLQSSGRLYYLRPGHLTRVVDGAEPTTLRVSPDELRMSGPQGEERIDLRTNAAVHSFVSSLVRIFAGDQAALEAAYELRFEAATDAGWSLRLRPRESPLTEMLHELQLHGHGHAVERIELLEPNGDRTLTRVEQADVERTFSAEEQRELFGIAPC